MFCTNCGTQNLDTAKFCISCGKEFQISSDTSQASNKTNPLTYEQQMLEAFIGKPEKVKYYLEAFSKFQNNPKKTIHWSWWGFFGNVWFLMYRKIWSWGLWLLIIFMLATYTAELFNYNELIIPLSLSLGSIGITGIHLIYQRYQRLKSEIETTVLNNADRIQVMKERGGYESPWKIIASMFIYGLIISAIELNKENTFQALRTNQTDTYVDESQQTNPNVTSEVESFFGNAEVSQVKDGYLEFDKSITVGQAFDNYAYFKSVEWTLLEDSQERKIVQMRGIYDTSKLSETKKNDITKFILMNPEFNNPTIENWGLDVHFTLNHDGTFNTTFAGHTAVVNGQFIEATQSQSANYILSSIYANNENSFVVGAFENMISSNSK